VFITQEAASAADQFHKAGEPTMTNSKAATFGAVCFAAWSTGNVDEAVQHLTDDVEILVPNGTCHGHRGYHVFMDGFVGMLTGVSNFTIYGHDTTAVAWYATHVQLVPTLVAGERITLNSNKIKRIEVAFDQMPSLKPSAPGPRTRGSPDRRSLSCRARIGALPPRDHALA
jgi:hypothetical protein